MPIRLVVSPERRFAVNQKFIIMSTTFNKTSERQFYIDWLRILLIISVFLYHIGMIFNSWGWHIKNDQQFKELRYVMTFLHYWRLPLLFMISGASTYYALGFRSSGQYLKERFKRLIIPLISGIFILVPVQVYIEKSSQFDSLLSFYPHMFEGIYPTGNFSWHHLWFIAYLFVISLFILPFLKFFRSEKYAPFMKWLEKRVIKPYGLNIFIIPLVLSQIIIRPLFPPNDNQDLIHDWASFTYYLLFFLTGFILLSNRTITEAIRNQRRLFLIESVLVTAFMFSVPSLADSAKTGKALWDIASIIMAWSCGMTAVGYARQYLNKDSKFRKLANEAIYPFYLLQQPVIVVIGYYITKWDISVFAKVILITGISLAISVSVYWFLIRPFNLLRIMFGMKSNKLRRQDSIQSEPNPVLIPLEPGLNILHKKHK